jgi:hypothetical protein
MQRGQLVSMECQNDLTGCRLSADTVATRYEYEDQLHYPFSPYAVLFNS